MLIGRFTRLFVAGGLSALCCAIVSASNTSESRELAREIIQRFEHNDNSGALELIDQYLEIRPDDGAMIYNAACAHCRLGQIDIAAKYLLDSIKAGYMNFSHMKRDRDLDPLHNHRAYRAIMGARDAADPLLAQRRIDEWQTRFSERGYRVEKDEQLHLNFLIADDSTTFAKTRQQIAAQGRLIESLLFQRQPDHAVLVVMPRPGDLDELFGSINIGGRYRHQLRELIALESEETLQHELVHVWHHSHMDRVGQEHPIWIQEGLACLFERYEITADEAIHFLPNERRNIAKKLLREDRLLSWPELFRMTPGDFRQDSIVAYSQVRSIFLFIADQGRLEHWYQSYVNQYDDDPSGMRMLEGIFSMKLPEIEARWRRWLQAQPTIVDSTATKSNGTTAMIRSEAKIGTENSETGNNRSSSMIHQEK